MIVPYSENASWDKHKVKRVLDNTNYLGTDCYPRLIDDDDFSAANLLKAERNVSTPLPCSEEIQSLKSTAFCRNCSGRFIRKINRHGRPRWKCVNTGCDNSVLLDDWEIRQSVTEALNHIIENPGILHIGQALRPTPVSVNKIQNEINREMSKTKPDTEHAQSLILSLAAEKYAYCTDTKAAIIFRSIFESHEPASQFDRGLFVATVSKVMISATGTISLCLNNGQTLPEP